MERATGLDVVVGRGAGSVGGGPEVVRVEDAGTTEVGGVERGVPVTEGSET